MKLLKYFSVVTLFLLPGLCSLTSCKDDVDESNMFSFTGDMVASYLQKDTAFTYYCNLLKKVTLSAKTKSTVMDLMSTYGNYTCFAPNNEAIHIFVDSIMEEKNYPLENLSDSIAGLIVKNSIIDCGNVEAYKSSTFSEGALSYTNLNERYVTVNYSSRGGKVAYIINSGSVITEPDIEVENGFIHKVDRVVSSSMAYLPALMQQVPNITIFTRLLKETGWENTMTVFLDPEYEAYYPTHEELKDNSIRNEKLPTPEHRKMGFTALVETDSVFMSKWGVPRPIVDGNNEIQNWDAIKQIIEDKCKQMTIYSQTSTMKGSPVDWKDPDNVVNQFVAYHILPQRRTSSVLVRHFNELGFASFTTERKLSPYNVDENYCTAGSQRRILRITEGKYTEGMRINRYSSYDAETYDEMNVVDQGILVSIGNGSYTNDALNGFYYPISDILEYTPSVRDEVLNTRMRWDLCSFVDEISSNGMIDPLVGVTNGLPGNYCAKIPRVTDESVITVRNVQNTKTGRNWRDYMGDEFLIVGQYDVTIEIPPVPTDGTYEIRIGLSNNNVRGMAQVYFGDNPDNLSAMGVPLDMRLKANDPNIEGVNDDKEDPDVAVENDKVMRNHGYMKGPKLVGIPNSGGVTTNLREVVGDDSPALRKILDTRELKADKKYYLRFKNVLKNEKAELFLDYLELVPKSVYAGAEKENVW